MNNELELLKKAHKEETVSIDFPIEIGGESIPVSLTAGDRFEIIKIQDDLVTEEMIRYSEKGWDKRPIDESEWESDLNNIKDPELRKRIQAQKPKNLARQKAEKFAKMKTVQELIPRFLRTKTGAKLCQNDEEINILRDMVKESPKLMTLFAKKFSELMAKETEVGEAVKNSSKQKDSQNG